MTKTLLLIPTSLEFEFIAPRVSRVDAVARCGFGPVAAAARASQLLTLHRPERVLLMGIAGRLSSLLEIGSAYAFDSVGCYGIGVGTRENFRTAGSMGWSHWDANLEDELVGDVLTLEQANGNPVSRQLLTVCSAANGPGDVRDRVACFPDALAEDMEGFGVACACRMHHVPLMIVRGVSNQAGERDHSKWKIESALQASAKLANSMAESAGWDS